MSKENPIRIGLCKGERKMTFEKVREIMVDTLSLEKDEIQISSNLFEDLGADSLDAVELNMALEEEYGITIPDEDLVNLKTVQDIVSYIDTHK